MNAYEVRLKEIAELEAQIEALDKLKDRLEDELAEKVGLLMFPENDESRLIAGTIIAAL